MPYNIFPDIAFCCTVFCEIILYGMSMRLFTMIYCYHVLGYVGKGRLVSSQGHTKALALLEASRQLGLHETLGAPAVNLGMMCCRP